MCGQMLCSKTAQRGNEETTTGVICQYARLERLVDQCKGSIPGLRPLQGASALASADRFADARHAVRTPLHFSVPPVRVRSSARPWLPCTDHQTALVVRHPRIFGVCRGDRRRVQGAKHSQGGSPGEHLQRCNRLRATGRSRKLGGDGPLEHVMPSIKGAPE